MEFLQTYGCTIVTYICRGMTTFLLLKARHVAIFEHLYIPSTVSESQMKYELCETLISVESSSTDYIDVSECHILKTLLLRALYAGDGKSGSHHEL